MCKFFTTFASKIRYRMTKLLQLLRYTIVILAYAYVVYTLVHFAYYGPLLRAWQNASPLRFVALGACVVLMPLNLYLEACRWRTAMHGVEPLTRREALAQVLAGLRGGFVTPYQLGDGPARVLYLRHTEQWVSALGMTVVTSISMTLTVLLLGLPALMGYHLPADGQTLPLVLSAAALMAATVGFIPLVRWLTRYPRWSARIRTALTAIDHLGVDTWARLFVLTVLRYGVFALQMYLALRFAGVAIPPTRALVALPVYYLVLLLAPTIPALDAGIKGAVAIWILAPLAPGSEAAVVLATVLIWIVNTLLPVVVSPIYTKK